MLINFSCVLSRWVNFTFKNKKMPTMPTNIVPVNRELIIQLFGRGLPLVETSRKAQSSTTRFHLQHPMPCSWDSHNLSESAWESIADDHTTKRFRLLRIMLGNRYRSRSRFRVDLIKQTGCGCSVLTGQQTVLTYQESQYGMHIEDCWRNTDCYLDIFVKAIKTYANILWLIAPMEYILSG